MIYRKKVPPTDSNLSEALINTGWKKIREPKNLFVAVMLSVPFMILNSLITLYFVSPIRNWLVELGRKLDSFSFVFTVDIKFFAYIIIVFAFLVVHELLHAIPIPDFMNSKKTFWGITPFGGFVSTTEEISKRRFVLISIIPFVVLSLIMPIILNFANGFNGFVVFLAIMNALGSSVDILNMLLIAIQVPNGSRIINNGFETYFK